MHLYASEPGGPDRRNNLVESIGIEDPDPLDRRREMRSDGRNLLRRDTARAGSKDEPQGIGPQLCGQSCVVEIGIAADLDPHGLAWHARGRGRSRDRNPDRSRDQA